MQDGAGGGSLPWQTGARVHERYSEDWATQTRTRDLIGRQPRLCRVRALVVSFGLGNIGQGVRNGLRLSSVHQGRTPSQ